MSDQPVKQMRQQRERRLVAEYLAIHFPGARIMIDVRLGVLPDAGTNGPYPNMPPGLFSAWRRWADALVFTGDEVIIVEGKIRPDVGVIGQLELYMKLVPKTAELRDLLTRPLVALLVTAVDDPALAELCRDKNFRYATFRPDWVDDYLSSIYPRAARAKGLG